MTEKELRKFNRLELLELLLEANSENRELKEKISSLISDNETAKSIENLGRMTEQMSGILEKASKLVEGLESKNTVASGEEEKTDKKDRVDRNLYVRMLKFYQKNDKALRALPSELEKDIRKRITEISEIIKN